MSDYYCSRAEKADAFVEECTDKKGGESLLRASEMLRS